MSSSGNPSIRMKTQSTYSPFLRALTTAYLQQSSRALSMMRLLRAFARKLVFCYPAERKVSGTSFTTAFVSFSGAKQESASVKMILQLIRPSTLSWPRLQLTRTAVVISTGLSFVIAPGLVTSRPLRTWPHRNYSGDISKNFALARMSTLTCAWRTERLKTRVSYLSLFS